MPRGPEELRALVEDYLDDLALTPELGTLAEPIRHALGGKRVRPVLCLAAGEAAGAEVESVLPAAAAVELVHSFSLVHDDLPALDNDTERRGRPTVWAAYGEATAVLAGDALLAEAMRLSLSYPTPDVARELVSATLGMIGGQQLDLTDRHDDLAALHALKTGALFSASVMCGLWAAGLPPAEHPPWRAFAAELGLLFQIVDDILDGDGYVVEVGAEDARRLADEAGDRALARLGAIDADTSALTEIVAGLVARTS
ncbi:MAG: polyprenyl synthetase family protein [Actinobacteria bacterium]|nr:polyprenyl synthetase family protein [Actinomycetota bacterium]MBV8396025.1 polyprenyl synthetase family protein [Actinomycetota bacterium]